MNLDKLINSVGDDFKFEAERSRIIDKFLFSVKDEKQRKALLKYQFHLDTLLESKK